MRFLIPAIAIAGVAMFAGSANAASFTIDDFTDADGATQTVSVPGVGSLTDSDAGLSGVVGGTREIFIDVTVDPNPAGGSTSVFTATERLSVSLGDSVVGTGGSQYLSLGGVDITAGELPANAFFQANVLSADQDVIMTVDITDTVAEGGDTATFVSAPLVAGDFVNEALGSFTGAGAVNFQQVDSIVITLSGPPAFDASISLLEVTSTPGGNGTAPEPSSIVMAICGLLGLAMTRRRRIRA